MITWLLDVDGVLNINKSPWHEKPRQKTVYALGRAFRMRYCPSLVREIKTIANEFDINVVWATSWANHIDQIEKCFGLYGWGTMFLPWDDPPAFDYKIHAAIEYQEKGHHLIWTDDHSPWAGTLANRQFHDRGHLLIGPDERYGLTPEDIDRIKEYANQHR